MGPTPLGRFPARSGAASEYPRCATGRLRGVVDVEQVIRLVAGHIEGGAGRGPQSLDPRAVGLRLLPVDAVDRVIVALGLWPIVGRFSRRNAAHADVDTPGVVGYGDRCSIPPQRVDLYLADGLLLG